MSRLKNPTSPFRYFNSSPDVIRLVVMMYVRFPLSLRNVEDLLFERGIDLPYETVRFWWTGSGHCLQLISADSVYYGLSGSGISTGSGIRMRCA